MKYNIFPRGVSLSHSPFLLTLSISSQAAWQLATSCATLEPTIDFSKYFWSLSLSSIWPSDSMTLVLPNSTCARKRRWSSRAFPPEPPRSRKECFPRSQTCQTGSSLCPGHSGKWCWRSWSTLLIGPVLCWRISWCSRAKGSLSSTGQGWHWIQAPATISQNLHIIFIFEILQKNCTWNVCQCLGLL